MTGNNNFPYNVESLRFLFKETVIVGEICKALLCQAFHLVPEQLILSWVMFSFQVWEVFIVHLLCTGLSDCVLFLSLISTRKAIFLLFSIVNLSPLESPDIESI